MNYVILFDLSSKLLQWWKVYSKEEEKKDKTANNC